MALTVRDLEIALSGRTILSSVSLQVAAESWVAVVGPNGAGKSTLLRGIAGLLRTSGEVRIAGSEVRTLRPRERARLVAYAPQDPTLPADMSVFDYALLGRSPYLSYLGREGAADRAIVAEVLDRLDLSAFAMRPLGQLSGGERQRAVLARALAQQAKVLLLDEPTTALDLGHQQQVLELVDRLRLSDGLTVLTTLHDLSLAGQYADSLVLLSRGGIAAAGPPADVLTEALILEHFEATVRVLPDPSGRPTITLTRAAPPSGGVLEA